MGRSIHTTISNLLYPKPQNSEASRVKKLSLANGLEKRSCVKKSNISGLDFVSRMPLRQLLSVVVRLQICLLAAVCRPHVRASVFAKGSGGAWDSPEPPFQLRLSKRSSALFELSCHNKCPFYGLSRAAIFAFLCFLLVISLLQGIPKHSAKVLSSVPGM